MSYQAQMSREELRLLRHHIKRRQREILYLQIELEEVEMDMDVMEVRVESFVLHSILVVFVAQCSFFCTAVCWAVLAHMTLLSSTEG